MHPDAVQYHSFSENRQVLVFPEVAGFIIDGRKKIYIERKPDASSALLALPFLGPVLAVWLNVRRKFTLHGSAVLHQGRAYGFVGDKGAGKSTLASMLLKNPGVEFITDDLLVITESKYVLRGYPQMKLSDEALSHSNRELGHVRPPPIEDFPKNQFRLDSQSSDEQVPVGCVFELRRSTEARIEDLDLQSALRVLLRFSYMSRYVDREMSSTEKQDLFRTTTQLAASGRVKRLYVPERIESLDEVINTFQPLVEQY
ncbi:MAG: hypothetical protein AAGL99_15325 [Pseudomonadota bacterium]